MNSYRSTSQEFVSIGITNPDGERIINNVQFSVVPQGQNEGAFTPGLIIGDEVGFMMTGKAPGVYTVWARIEDVSEIPVLNCGIFRVV